MRYRITNDAQIPPAQGEAEKLLENLAADYQRFYAMQDRMLRGARHPLEDFARKLRRGMAERFSRVSRVFAVRVSAALLAVVALIVLYLLYSALPKETPKETTYVPAAAEAPFIMPRKALDEASFLNRATADDLDKIPGIGEVLAARIIVEREKNGPFAFVEDILLTPGIGQKKLNAIVKYVEELEED